MAELTLGRLWFVPESAIGGPPRPASQADLETVLAGLVVPGRLIIETPCEHGISVKHLHGFGPQTAHCPGGSRRRIGESE